MPVPTDARASRPRRCSHAVLTRPLFATISGWAQFYTGDVAAARATLAAVQRAGRPDVRSQAALAGVEAAAGDHASARARVLAIAAGPYMDHHVAYSLGAAWAQLGDVGASVKWLQRASDTGFPVIPGLRRTRCSIRFAAILNSRLSIGCASVTGRTWRDIPRRQAVDRDGTLIWRRSAANVTGDRRCSMTDEAYLPDGWALVFLAFVFLSSVAPSTRSRRSSCFAMPNAWNTNRQTVFCQKPGEARARSWPASSGTQALPPSTRATGNGPVRRGCWPIAGHHSDRCEHRPGSRGSHVSRRRPRPGNGLAQLPPRLVTASHA